MSPRLRWAALLCWLSVAAAAQPADPTRERIAAERTAAAATLREREDACRLRFVVTACMDAARTEHRATLAKLRRQELRLDEAMRAQAAAARRQVINDKADARPAAPAGDPAWAPPSEKVRHAPVRNPPGPDRSTRGDRSLGPANADPGTSRRAAERRNEEKFDARARAAQAHRDSVERRNTQSAAQGKVAPPLPIPSAASAP